MRRQERVNEYLRYGHLPPGGRSPRSGHRATGGLISTYEIGVSVFRCLPLSSEDEGYKVDVSPSIELAHDYGGLSVCGRPAYLAKGLEVGVGLSGEPILDPDTVELLPLPPGTPIRSSGHHKAAEE